MKKLNQQLLILLLVVCVLPACKKENDNKTTPTQNNGLTYSPSPIDLNGMDVQFSKNNSYGPYAENTFDIFMPKSATPTPLVIYIHGGGFLGGEKEAPYALMWSGSWDFPSEIRTLLANNIAFASINYRLLAFEGDTDGVIKSLNDSKRCLQYIRYISDRLNIDKNNIVLAGSSAGGGASEWLAFGNDRADSLNADPVLRESTRVKAIAVKATQASYDLERDETVVFKEYNFKWSAYFKEDPEMVPRFLSFYGIDSLAEFNSPAIIAYRKKVDMLAMMSIDDPEFWADNPQTPVVKPTKANILNHHSFQARALKEWGDSIGIPNVVSYGNYQDPSGETFVGFMIRKIQE